MLSDLCPLILVPMQNLTVAWGPVIPYTVDTRTNITCTSIRSRPAADLRWFYGTIDITNTATSYYKQTGADGKAYQLNISMLAAVAGKIISIQKSI